MTRLSRLALIVSVALVAPVQAAEADFPLAAAATPVEELTELDEVRVRGKLVANAVVAAERRVYRLYNKLNTQDRFDVSCGDTPPPPNLWNQDRWTELRSMCLPEFLSRYAPVAPDWGDVVTRHWDCTRGCNSGRFVSYERAGMNELTLLPAFAFNWVAPPIVPPVAERTAFAENVVRVMNSDPELQRMAAGLAGMYEEMDRVKAQLAQLQQQKQEARSEKVKASRERARARGRELHPPRPRAL